MAKRNLIIDSYSHAVPTSARCSDCHRPFRVDANESTTPEAAREHLKAEFDAHNCKEDFSQAAVRIVREATDKV
jgi:hypothetical protein